MWPGPYGDRGSRKYLLGRLDQSSPTRPGLRRHLLLPPARPGHPARRDHGRAALGRRQGKALYVGISSYGPERTRQAASILRELGTPLLIHQPSYSMLNRWVEGGLLDVLEEDRRGMIAFTALAQGLLTGKYLDGIPDDSRAARAGHAAPTLLTEHAECAP